METSGGGLSGLLLAVALQKYAPDVEFDIYEAASDLSEIGAGIGLHFRTWNILQALGLDEALLKVAGDDADSSEYQLSCFGMIINISFPLLS